METIDWESQQLKVFNALKEGNLALQQLHEEMPLEKVEELMADTAENIAMEEEISKAIGGSWTDANEEDLLAELAVLEKEELGEATPAAAAAAAAPAPIRKPSKAAASVTVTEPTVTAVEPAQGAGQSLEELLPEAPTGPVTVSVRKQEEEEEEGEKERPVLVPA
ncbi:unnamed protein product [Laminaria digitata]